MSPLCNLAVAAAMWMLLVVPVTAQEEVQEVVVDDASDTAQIPETEEADEIEEIIVVSPRPGSRVRVDEDIEDLERAQLLKEFYRMKELEEEYEWRTSASSDDSSRVKWGYDPRDEYRMRNDTALQDLSFEKQKPASIFRVEF